MYSNSGNTSSVALLPRAHLHAAEDDRHVFQRAGGEATAPRHRAQAAGWPGRRATGRATARAAAAGDAVQRRRRTVLDRRRLRPVRAHDFERRDAGRCAHLSADTVAAMRRNQIGALGVRALKTAQPALSMDFSFVDDGKDKWGLGFLITSTHVAGKRSAGSVSGAGSTTPTSDRSAARHRRRETQLLLASLLRK